MCQPYIDSATILSDVIMWTPIPVTSTNSRCACRVKSKMVAYGKYKNDWE